MSDLLFPSQAKAEQHLLAHQIKSYKQEKRLTRSRAERVKALQELHEALYEPVYTLPDEILAEIFKAGAIEGDEDGMVDIKFSLTVSWVVSRWRRVALSTPALWRTLKMILPLNNSDEQMKWTTLLERTRGSAYLLDLYIMLHPDARFLSFSNHILLEVKAVPRTRTIAIHSAASRYEQYVLPPSQPSSFPSLMNLFLAHVSFHAVSVFLIMLSSFPGLHALRLHGVNINGLDTDEIERQKLSTVNLKELDEISFRDTLVRGFLDTHTVLQYLKLPRLQKLLLHTWDGEVKPYVKLRTVSTLVLAVTRVQVQSPNKVLSLVCALPRLTDLKLDMDMKPVPINVPREVRVPPLAHVDFLNSQNVDGMARWFVDRTVLNRPGGPTLKKVSLAIDGCPNTISPMPISEITQQWIQEKGVQVLTVASYTLE